LDWNLIDSIVTSAQRSWPLPLPKRSVKMLEIAEMRVTPHALTWLAASALLLFGSGSASAQNTSDAARCFVVSTIFASAAKDQTARQLAEKAKIFYLGRLTGTAVQIEAALSQQAKAITQQSAGGIMQACGRSFAQKSAEVQRIGERLAKSRRK
jgi:hypothetical protein